MWPYPFYISMCAIFALVIATYATVLTRGNGVINGQMTQYVVFYTESGCQGESRNFTETNLDIPGTGDEVMNRTVSFMSNGLWKVSFTGGLTLTRINRYEFESCGDYTNDFGVIKSIERFHSYDFDDPAFLISEDGYYGEPRHNIPPDAGMTLYNPPIEIGAWAFTGNDSYVLYEGSDYNGSVVCAGPDEGTKERGYGMQWGNMIPFPVGAIQRVYTCPDYATQLTTGVD